MKQIAICADDYGLSPAISDGIRQLVAKERLTTVSCITTQADWLTQAKLLQSMAQSIEIGLHFNLTEGKLLYLTQPFSLPKILWHSHTRLLKPQVIKLELLAQLDAFAQAFGRWPDFIDGHQHVHHLPVIRDVLVEVWQEKNLSPCWIRLAIEQHPCAPLKSFIIRNTGALALRQQLLALNIPHNKDFAGVYSFAKSSHFPEYCDFFLQHLADRGLFMCHAGLNDPSDPLQNIRATEFAYLMSETFLQALTHHAISLKPLRPIINSTRKA